VIETREEGECFLRVCLAEFEFVDFANHVKERGERG